MRLLRNIFVLLTALVLCACQGGPPTPGSTVTPQGGTASPHPDGHPGGTRLPAASATPDNGDAVRLHKTTIKTRQGQKWELEAGEVDWFDERSKAKAKEVVWWLLDEDDKRWVKVESPKADIDMDHEVVTFVGKTVATRLGFPESLEVQHLVYKGKDRKFYGSGGVVWKRANLELTGEALTATSQLDKVQLKGDVQGKSKGGFEWFDELRQSE
jgi:LPS export ABC transporter protein LptC